MDAANNQATITGVSSFSDWTLAEGDAPTAVMLSSFTATEYEEGVLLWWRTGHEVNNLGFHVYREEEGRRTRLNPQMIAGSALRAGQGINTAGYSYSWLDAVSDPLSARSQEELGEPGGAGRKPPSLLHQSPSPSGGGPGGGISPQSSPPGTVSLLAGGYRPFGQAHLAWTHPSGFFRWPSAEKDPGRPAEPLESPERGKARVRVRV